ncbi:uncharacterized protein A4U43_C08F23460 [Asparagus officinalis]|nr:uncharacterized protein A4U43_C08F23460 [Asparagus officinalis]
MTTFLHSKEIVVKINGMVHTRNISSQIDRYPSHFLPHVTHNEHILAYKYTTRDGQLLNLDQTQSPRNPSNNMAITSYDTTTRALNWDMTVEEFKEWIKKFDINGDGRISKAELRRVIRSLGGRFSSWKSRRWIQQADSDGDGYIEEDEIDNLVEYAQKTLGLKIVAY